MGKKYGILVANLGTPDNTSPEAVGRYLKEFLLDPDVLQMPALLRHFLVRVIIVPRRKFQSAKAYESIWTKEGAPLLVSTKALTQELRENLPYPVEMGMRYGSPSLQEAASKLKDQCDEIYVLPLYPQEAASTTGSMYKKMQELNVPFVMEKCYAKDSFYIDSLVESFQDNLPANRHLLLSFHGLPESHLKKEGPGHCLTVENCCDLATDAFSCYRKQCFDTANALRAKLPHNPITVAFQSRLGRDPWLSPATADILAELPKKGVKNLAVACPGFLCDNLETLEEIAIAGKETFLEAGGESFHFIPCLNSQSHWIQRFKTFVDSKLQELR